MRIAEENPPRDERVKQLYKMTKPVLARHFIRISGWVGGIHPSRWSKDELVNEVLRIEFPDRTSDRDDEEWLFTTKSGKQLTDADLDAFAAEAEAGYDPATIGPGVTVGEQRRWTSRVSPRDPHTVLRLDLANRQVLIKYSDGTTDWCPKGEYLAETART